MYGHFPGGSFRSVFPCCSRETGGRRTRLWQRGTIIGIVWARLWPWGVVFGAVIEGRVRTWYNWHRDQGLESRVLVYNTNFEKRRENYRPTGTQTFLDTDRLRLYKQEMEKEHSEFLGLLLIRRRVLRSPNCHGKNTPEPRKRRQKNSDHQTIWLNWNHFGQKRGAIDNNYRRQ